MAATTANAALDALTLRNTEANAAASLLLQTGSGHNTKKATLDDRNGSRSMPKMPTRRLGSMLEQKIDTDDQSVLSKMPSLASMTIATQSTMGFGDDDDNDDCDIGGNGDKTNRGLFRATSILDFDDDDWGNQESDSGGIRQSSRKMASMASLMEGVQEEEEEDEEEDEEKEDDNQAEEKICNAGTDSPEEKAVAAFSSSSSSFGTLRQMVQQEDAMRAHKLSSPTPFHNSPIPSGAFSAATAGAGPFAYDDAVPAGTPPPPPPPPLLGPTPTMSVPRSATTPAPLSPNDDFHNSLSSFPSPSPAPTNTNASLGGFLHQKLNDAPSNSNSKYADDVSCCSSVHKPSYLVSPGRVRIQIGQRSPIRGAAAAAVQRRGSVGSAAAAVQRRGSTGARLGNFLGFHTSAPIQWDALSATSGNANAKARRRSSMEHVASRRHEKGGGDDDNDDDDWSAFEEAEKTTEFPTFPTLFADSNQSIQPKDVSELPELHRKKSKKGTTTTASSISSSSRKKTDESPGKKKTKKKRAASPKPGRRNDKKNTPKRRHSAGDCVCEEDPLLPLKSSSDSLGQIPDHLGAEAPKTSRDGQSESVSEPKQSQQKPNSLKMALERDSQKNTSLVREEDMTVTTTDSTVVESPETSSSCKKRTKSPGSKKKIKAASSVKRSPSTSDSVVEENSRMTSSSAHVKSSVRHNNKLTSSSAHVVRTSIDQLEARKPVDVGTPSKTTSKSKSKNSDSVGAPTTPKRRSSSRTPKSSRVRSKSKDRKSSAARSFASPISSMSYHSAPAPGSPTSTSATSSASRNNWKKLLTLNVGGLISSAADFSAHSHRSSSALSVSEHKPSLSEGTSRSKPELKRMTKSRSSTDLSASSSSKKQPRSKLAAKPSAVGRTKSASAAGSTAASSSREKTVLSEKPSSVKVANGRARISFDVDLSELERLTGGDASTPDAIQRLLLSCCLGQ